MIQALLFDLDDTLLRNEAKAFFRNYTRLLTPHLAPWLTAEQVSDLMWRGTERMMANADPGRLLIDCFWQYAAEMGYPVGKLAPAFDRFYDSDYGQLEQHTEPIPDGRKTLIWASEQGFRLVLATNPLFPETAVMKRLEWANVADIAYALVTTCENMHYAKPNPLYYREIADAIGCRADQCLMVGNDLRFDMVAGEVGMRTYLVADGPAPDDVVARVDGHGPLSDLPAWLEANARP